MNSFDWGSFISGILAGGVLLRICSFIGAWMNDKGVELVEEKLKAFGDKLNQNQLLGQIKADDAVLKIVEDALPVVVSKLNDTLQADLADGKLDKENWQNILSELWAAAEPQVKGGAMDYLQHSSFSDGIVVAEQVLKKFVGQKKMDKASVATKG